MVHRCHDAFPFLVGHQTAGHSKEEDCAGAGAGAGASVETEQSSIETVEREASKPEAVEKQS
ncbi:hypothetical protein SLEP1_g45436 [Rubroshorea leprosula]|uniref:Uncharacterized protein n=1 Tax=Rubroshorea leprosula TaxID=152421 RepID=A0AAV5LL99_9ROSI|nr:hypothetical protein SLEP1_g45436 [Rubroshorea leprosula]